MAVGEVNVTTNYWAISYSDKNIDASSIMVGKDLWIHVFKDPLKGFRPPILPLFTCWNNSVMPLPCHIEGLVDRWLGEFAVSSRMSVVAKFFSSTFFKAFRCSSNHSLQLYMADKKLLNSFPWMNYKYKEKSLLV